jgi:hypothetical protein
MKLMDKPGPERSCEDGCSELNVEEHPDSIDSMLSKHDFAPIATPN